jgi:alpha-ketoglutarate-dependent taurine dioxygenase
VLIDLFARYIRRPENSVRWYWQVGDLAVWDNRATEHYAVHDYGNQPRLMHRIALDGELPRGVDGTPSRALAPTQTRR